MQDVFFTPNAEQLTEAAAAGNSMQGTDQSFEGSARSEVNVDVRSLKALNNFDKMLKCPIIYFTIFTGGVAGGTLGFFAAAKAQQEQIS